MATKRQFERLMTSMKNSLIEMREHDPPDSHIPSMSIKKRIFGEYIAGPKTNGRHVFTRILITKPVEFDQARAALRESPEYNPKRCYTQLQALPNNKDIDIVFL